MLESVMYKAGDEIWIIVQKFVFSELKIYSSIQKTVILQVGKNEYIITKTRTHPDDIIGLVE